MKVSLVTGASSGLGRDIAKLLCGKGHIVYATARSKDKLLELKEECSQSPGKVKVVVGDLTDSSFRIKLIRTIIQNEKKIDYLINNAGFGKVTNFENTDLKDIEGMFALNAVAGEHLSQLVLPFMKKQNKGRIINISSVVALAPPVYMAPYNATKFAVYGFSKSLSYELEGAGVYVSVVFPSRMKTPFWDVAFKCKGLDGDAQKSCIMKYTKSAKGSLPVAKYIVRKLDSKGLILTPDLLSWVSYHILRHFYFIGDFYVKNIMLPQSKKLLFIDHGKGAP
jgi:short-subunit dehydrogenase